jgi:hypothetical protein
MKIGKSGKKYPEMKNLVPKSAKYIVRIKKLKGSNLVFYVLLKQKLQYYCGITKVVLY